MGPPTPGLMGLLCLLWGVWVRLPPGCRPAFGSQGVSLAGLFPLPSPVLFLSTLRCLRTACRGPACWWRACGPPVPCTGGCRSPLVTAVGPGL